MQEYRKKLKEHFENNHVIGGLLKSDFILYGFGLLFIIFSAWSIIVIRTDLFSALGFWLFWIGISFAYIGKNDLTLSIGLGGYILVYFVVFIKACINSANHGGFYGINALLNIAVVGYFLALTIHDSDYFKKYMQNKSKPSDNVIKPSAGFDSSEEIICPNCARAIGSGTPFCPYCGTAFEDARNDTSSELLFEESGINSDGLSEAMDSDKLICPSCGNKIIPGKKFCTHCGAKTQIVADNDQSEVLRENGGNPKSDREEIIESKDSDLVETEENVIADNSSKKMIEKTICSSCGSEIPSGKNICVICGQTIADENTHHSDIIDSEENKIKSEVSAASDSVQKPENSNKKICSSCGAEVGENKKFCKKCGAKLTDVAQTDMQSFNRQKTISADRPIPVEEASENLPKKIICPSCGGDIPAGMKFCTKCGTKL